MSGLVALPSVDAATLGQGAAKVPSATDKTKEAAQQFEGLLMSLLFQAMRKTIQPSGLLGDSGHSRSTYEYLMDQAVASKAAASGKGWGLAERLEEAWSRRDEAPRVPAKA
ncbi:MAG TPA: rod-binding protein [Holophagaceae bacterium]